MKFLSLLSGPVLSLATFFILVCIAALLAWMAGFFYARQQRFQDDLLTTFRRAGFGSDIEAPDHVRRSRAANTSRNDIEEKQTYAATIRARHKPAFKFPTLSLGKLARSFALIVVLSGIGVGGYYGYHWSQADVIGLSERANDTIGNLIDQMSGETYPSETPTDSSSLSSPVSSAEPTAPAGPYGPIDRVQAADSSFSADTNQP